MSITEDGFKFDVCITRAFEDPITKNIDIEGVSSSTSIDSHRTIFSEKCQENWKTDFINGQQTLIELNHDGKRDWTRRIGVVTEMKTQPNPNKEGITDFFIRAELDKDNPDAVKVFKAINEPKVKYGQPEKLAMSINGFAEQIRTEIIDGEVIEVFDKVRLWGIGIVEFGSNPDTFISAILRNQEINRKKEVMMDKEVNSTTTITEPVASEPIVTPVEIPAVPVVETPVTREEVMTGAINDVGAEKNAELVALAQNLCIEVKDEIEKVKDLKTETLVNTIKGMLNLIQNKFSWEHWDIVYRNFDSNVISLTRDVTTKTDENSNVISDNKEIIRDNKMSEENKDVSTPVVEVKDNEALELMRSLTESFKTVKTEVDQLKTENATLRSELKTIGEKPSGQVANLVPNTIAINNENTLNRADIIQALKEGKLSNATRAKVEEIMLNKAFGIK